MNHRVTMADVAREAGVSVMTVSRVINNKNGISDATRQRIQQIIDRLGYRPSGIARGLVTNRTGTIGLVVIDNSNPFFSEVARGVEHVAYTAGYNVFLCNTEEDPQRERAVLFSLEEKRVDGLILASSRLAEDELNELLGHYPHAVLVNRAVDNPHIGQMLIDDETSAYRATRHLIASGHSAIGHIAGPERSHSSAQRTQGYRRALDEADLPVNPAWITHCMPVVSAGKESALDLLQNHPELTAIFCYNDLLAIGALQACAELGRRVPEDVAIVGFDDIPLASLVTPTLTTCRAPQYDLGQQAMQFLLDRMNQVVEVQSRIVFDTQLIVRDSAP